MGGMGVSIAAADEAIRSAWFWAYARTLDVVAEAMGAVCRWAEGSP
jgi:hypothetical protein